MSIIDYDQDGLADNVDPNPKVFTYTAQNKGKRMKDGKQIVDNPATSYGTAEYNAAQGIQPLKFLDIIGIDPVDAKNWFSFADTNAQYKGAYNTFKANVGRLGLPTDKKTLQAVWNRAVDWTQTKGTNNGDPFNYLESLNPEDFRKESTGPKYGTQAVKDIRTTEYSGSSAAQQISDEMERRLGRRATQSEIDAYTKGVNKMSQKEPSVYEGSTTTAAPKGKNTLGSTVSTGKQTTGFDPTMFARNFAMSQPDYAESFAANTFLGLVEKLLKDPNAIGEVVSDGR
jgi:hypothetical protein